MDKRAAGGYTSGQWVAAISWAGMVSGNGLEIIELFAGLPAAALAAIEARAEWHLYAAGDQVFDQDSDTFDVYFIVSGCVRILTTQPPDREVTLAQVGAGNYFGELAAIDGKGRSARVVAAEESRLASIDGPSFLQLLQDYPQLAVRVLLRFSRIIRRLDDRISDLAVLDEGQRVMVELLRLAQPDPRRPDSFSISDLPNHKELASWAGTSREAVARTIGELLRMGVVERRSMSLTIRDRPRLQTLARQIPAAR